MDTYSQIWSSATEIQRWLDRLGWAGVGLSAVGRVVCLGVFDLLLCVVGLARSVGGGMEPSAGGAVGGSGRRASSRTVAS
ncbi:hypothetical protein Tco_1050867 [Tanacetum coccineum]